MVWKEVGLLGRGHCASRVQLRTARIGGRGAQDSDKVRHIPLACLWEEAWVPQVGSRGGANRLLEVEVNLHTDMMTCIISGWEL